jgi:DNA replication protein DnaC
LALRCDRCQQPIYTEIEGLILPKNCKCSQEELNKTKEQEQAEINKETQRKLDKLKKFSMMDDKFYDCTFENYEIDEDNKKLYKFALKYCNHWEEMYHENIGVMFLGSQGIGKSYTSFAIANRLLANMVPVIAISTIGLLDKIKTTYSKFGNEGESEILHQLSNAKLLILDDLGVENDTAWAKEKLYEIIDTRDRQGKPLIVTTNLTKEQLQNKLTGSDGVNRTYDRLIKMCQPIEVKGTSKRIDEAKRKEEVLRKILY